MNCSAVRLISKELVLFVSHKCESQSQTQVCIHDSLKRKKKEKNMKRFVTH